MSNVIDLASRRRAPVPQHPPSPEVRSIAVIDFDDAATPVDALVVVARALRFYAHQGFDHGAQAQKALALISTILKSAEGNRA
jgi:hypothetical protein